MNTFSKKISIFSIDKEADSKQRVRSNENFFQFYYNLEQGEILGGNSHFQFVVHVQVDS